MWYAIQTITGNEEEAAEGIKKMVDAESYEDCFLLKREAVWTGVFRGSAEFMWNACFPDMCL